MADAEVCNCCAAGRLINALWNGLYVIGDVGEEQLVVGPGDIVVELHIWVPVRILHSTNSTRENVYGKAGIGRFTGAAAKIGGAYFWTSTMLMTRTTTFS